MKITILILAILFASATSIAQDENWKDPCRWFNKEVATTAKTLLDDEKIVTFYKCATGEISLSISIKSVKIKPSTTGDNYYEVFITGKDQSGEKKTISIGLDEVWLPIGEKYSNLADELGIERKKCIADDMPSYLK